MTRTILIPLLTALPMAGLPLTAGAADPGRTPAAVSTQSGQSVDGTQPDRVEEVRPAPEADDASELGVGSNFELDRDDERNPPETADNGQSEEMLSNVQAVIASVRSQSTMPDEPLSHLRSTEEVRIVPFSSLPGQDEPHSPTLDEALSENAEAIAAIRGEIGSNIYAMRALEADGMTADDVLTFETAGTQQVTIIVDDRS